MYILWPIKIQVLEVRARVATGGGVRRGRGRGKSPIVARGTRLKQHKLWIWTLD